MIPDSHAGAPLTPPRTWIGSSRAAPPPPSLCPPTHLRFPQPPLQTCMPRARGSGAAECMPREWRSRQPSAHAYAAPALNAGMPVMAFPRMSAWTSCVP
eukprot:5720224-Prymnesium_polylepis.2